MERDLVVTKGELLALFPEMLKGAAYGLGLGLASVSLYIFSLLVLLPIVAL